MVSPLALLLLSACDGLDRVPIVAGPHCAAEREDVKVACVLDGDTFQVGDACGGESVRLLAVDAAEIAHDSTEQDYCWGPEATEWLAELLEGETVTLRFDATECVDDHERTLAYAYLEDPDTDEELLVNYLAIREGMAQVYRDFDDVYLADLLYSAEEAAKRENLGMWAECQ